MSYKPLRPSTSMTRQRADTGALFVFEGPDGVGKSEIVTGVQRALSSTGARQAIQLSFPGREPGTLGHHVYQLHHNSNRFGVTKMAPASRQLLHVAAHLDAIEGTIRPFVEQGAVVLLDRYWWSTWVYGVIDGVDRRTLRAMIDLERLHWGSLMPTALFLVRRKSSLRPEEDTVAFDRRRTEYDALASAEATTTRVVSVDNDGDLAEATAAVLEVVRAMTAEPERP